MQGGAALVSHTLQPCTSASSPAPLLGSCVTPRRLVSHQPPSSSRAPFMTPTTPSSMPPRHHPNTASCRQVHATSPPRHAHRHKQSGERERKRVRGGDLHGGEGDANDAGAGVVDGLDAVAAKRLRQPISLDDGADSSRAELLHLPVISHVSADSRRTQVLHLPLIMHV